MSVTLSQASFFGNNPHRQCPHSCGCRSAFSEKPAFVIRTAIPNNIYFLVLININSGLRPQEFVMNEDIVKMINEITDFILAKTGLGKLPDPDKKLRLYVSNKVQLMLPDFCQANENICNRAEGTRVSRFGRAKPTNYSVEQQRLHANAVMQRDKMVELGIDQIAIECRQEYDKRYPMK